MVDEKHHHFLTIARVLEHIVDFNFVGGLSLDQHLCSKPTGGRRPKACSRPAPFPKDVGQNIVGNTTAFREVSPRYISAV